MFKDRVKDTTTTTGTGNVTLTGTAPTGFVAFDTAFGHSGTTFYYCIEDGTNWEVGEGTLSDATTLVRTTVLASSNAGAAVDFPAGTKSVFNTIAGPYLNNLETEAIGISINSATAITTGIKGYASVPYAATIQSVTMIAAPSGSVVIEIYKDSYANHPPTSGDKITASAPPTISAATKSVDTTLTGWTTAIAAGDVLCFEVISVSGITNVTLTMKVAKTL